MAKSLYQLEAKLQGTLLQALAQEANTASIAVSLFDKDNPSNPRTPDGATLLFEIDPENTTGKQSEYILATAHSTVSGVTTFTNVFRGLPRDNTIDLVGNASLANQWDENTPLAVVTEPYNINLIKAYFEGNESVPDNMQFANGITITNGNIDMPANSKINWDGGLTYIGEDGAGNQIFKDQFNAQKTLSDLTAAAGTDEKVKASINDTTQSFLNDKLTAGSGISLTIQNPAANENIEIAFNGATAPSIPATLDVEAGENFPAYTTVIRIKEDGKGYLATDTRDVKQAPDLKTFDYSTQIPGSPFVIISRRLTSNKYVFLSRNNALDLIVFVGEITNGVWNLGTAVNLGGSTNNPTYRQFDIIDSSRFAVVWVQSGTGDNLGKVLSVAGVTLTPGANITVVASAGNSNIDPTVCAVQSLGVGAVMYAWNRSAIPSTQARAAFLTGVTQTPGATTTVDTPSNLLSRPYLVRARENEALLLFSDSDDSVQSVVLSQTNNTNAFSVNALQGLGFDSYLNGAFLERVADDKILFSHIGTFDTDSLTDPNTIDANIITIAGTVPSISSVVNLHDYETAEFDSSKRVFSTFLFPTETANKFICLKLYYVDPKYVSLYGGYNLGSTIGTYGFIDTSGSAPSIKWSGLNFSSGAIGSASYEDGDETIHLLNVFSDSGVSDNHIIHSIINQNDIIGFSNVAVTSGQTATINVFAATNLTTDSNADGVAFDTGGVYYTAKNGKLIKAPEKGGYPILKILDATNGTRVSNGPRF